MRDTIRITRATTRRPRPKDQELGFGTVFTDHMFLADFEEEKGWYDPRIEPYGPLTLEPSAAVLHYAGTQKPWHARYPDSGEKDRYRSLVARMQEGESRAGW